MKQQKYSTLISQVRVVNEGESDLIAVLANTAALIHHNFGFWWTGFYIVRGDELVLGPFQGPVACTRIAKGRGVCGSAWAQDRAIIVPDVEKFPGHVACSSLSRSEIVVPVRDADGNFVAELDIDSRELDTFDETDAENLATLVQGLWR